MRTPIPDWAVENAVEGKGVMCPECGGLETRSWYSAAKPGAERNSYLLSIHEPCKTAWVQMGV
jgi:hypothetical protein